MEISELKALSLPKHNRDFNLWAHRKQSLGHFYIHGHIGLFSIYTDHFVEFSHIIGHLQCAVQYCLVHLWSCETTATIFPSTPPASAKHQSLSDCWSRRRNTDWSSLASSVSGFVSWTWRSDDSVMPPWVSTSLLPCHRTFHDINMQYFLNMLFSSIQEFKLLLRQPLEYAVFLKYIAGQCSVI